MAGFAQCLVLASLISTGMACGTSETPPSAPAIKSPVTREVTFVGADNLTLQGTLTLPPGKSLPAVLLLPGSGPTDRDGNQNPVIVTNLLKRLSDELVKEGFATLRFDKRAIASYVAAWPKEPAKQSEYFGWDRFTKDAKAALGFLQSQPEIDATRTAILGHSEGSMLAMQIGKDLNGKKGAPKALVLIAAPGRTLEPIIREQLSASLGRSNASSEMIKQYMDYTEAAFRQIKEKGTFPPNPPQGLGAIFNPSAASLFKSYVTIDSTDNLKAFSGPVLVMQGDKDIQISVERDLPLLEKTLKKRGGKFEVKVIPSASHNLKLVLDASKEMGLTGPIAAEATSALVAWAKANL